MMNVQNSEKLQEKFRFDTVQYDHPKEDKPMNKIVLGTLYDVIDDCFFVTEEVYFGKNFEGNDNWRKSTRNLASFDDYFGYLDGASLIEDI